MSYQILNGNNIDLLKTLPDNSIDAIVTDPPYGLSKQPDMVEVFTQWMQTGEYTHKSKGFMGKDWDSFVPSPNLWKECFRVLKPGGHVLAFYGTRTYDLGVLAMRIAGFEVRNQLAWVYGSGFPKSHNISKAIDKAKPKSLAQVSLAITKSGLSDKYIADKINVSSALVRFWRLGERTIQKDQLIALSELIGSKIDFEEDKRVCVGITQNAMSGWNMDGSTKFKDRDILKGTTEKAQKWEGWGTDLKPAQEPIVLARKPFKGSVAENVLEHGTGGLNIDGCRVGETGSRQNGRKASSELFWSLPVTTKIVYDRGRFPANFVHDGSDEVNDLLPDNAQRFFYVPKCSKKDRNEGLDAFEDKAKVFNGHSDKSTSSGYQDGSVEDKFSTQPQKNFHPTVKPTDLMRYLVRMITPQGGVVLDPFMGSGSTGKAAILEGFQFIGMELSEEYCEIAKARIDYVANNKT